MGSLIIKQQAIKATEFRNTIFYLGNLASKQSTIKLTWWEKEFLSGKRQKAMIYCIQMVEFQYYLILCKTSELVLET